MKLSNIHPTAIVSPNAQIDDSVRIGPYSIIEDEVEIGENTEVHSAAVIANGTSIGAHCRIFSGAVIGNVPQDLKFENEKTFVSIGDHTTIREYVTINRATNHSVYTRIGAHCLIMAYVHVAHDCQIGNHVVVANAVNMAGHVHIGDNAGIGGMCAIHQFVRIGTQSFIEGRSAIKKDVPPYILAMGEPLKFGGLNSVGLSRRGINPENMSQLKKAYKIIYRQNLTLEEATEKISQDITNVHEIETLLDFLKGCERGIIR